jgi:Uma2 family endonuclease
MSMPEISPASIPVIPDYDVPVPPAPRMTEDEFVAWCNEDIRAEWVDGEVIIMSPESYDNDDLQTWVAAVLRAYVEQKELGRVLGPNFQVRFASQRRRRVPDVIFVQRSRLEILRRNHLEGPPDWAIEIVSPESQSRDRRDKFFEYQTAGVREYWIIDPMSETVEAYTRSANGLFESVTTSGGVVSSSTVPGFSLEVEWFWEPKRPKIVDVLRRLGVV